MRRFSDLYEALDSTSSTGAKVEAMAQYFRAAPAEDAAWAVFFLTGQRSKRLISGRTLRAWALRYTGLPEWLVGDAQAATGDSAETVTLLVHRGTSAEREPLSLHRWLEERILPLRELADEQQYAKVSAWWRQLPLGELFVLNKLLTGTFRVGVSQPLVVRALGAVSGVPRATIAHRLAGRWQPTAT
jgi:DNA ligase 1